MSILTFQFGFSSVVNIIASAVNNNLSTSANKNKTITNSALKSACIINTESGPSTSNNFNNEASTSNYNRVITNYSAHSDETKVNVPTLTSHNCTVTVNNYYHKV